jgi:hypothetical protein
MAILRRRATAVLALLALCAGNVAVCAGWQSTAEARMACCKSAMHCPMHESDGRGHGSHAGITQKDADDCCAAAPQRRDSDATARTFVIAGVMPAPAIPFASPIAAPVPPMWRAVVPLRGSPVPRHLLLSVLLV